MSRIQQKTRLMVVSANVSGKVLGHLNVSSAGRIYWCADSLLTLSVDEHANRIFARTLLLHVHFDCLQGCAHDAHRSLKFHLHISVSTHSFTSNEARAFRLIVFLNL